VNEPLKTRPTKTKLKKNILIMSW